MSTERAPRAIAFATSEPRRTPPPRRTYTLGQSEATATLGHLGREVHIVELAAGVLHLDTVFKVVDGLALIAEQGVKDVDGLTGLLTRLGVPGAVSVSDDEVDRLATNFLCVNSHHVLMSDTCASTQAMLESGASTSPLSR
ncbi:MAG TPA: hypothetical protein VGZ33_07505 [Acidimicrobiales bacterium]|jgi:N-dimethylarginine dimethylaminohydrolase|nr:hypothetical protein [Acidimicrobiales bacterium]